MGQKLEGMVVAGYFLGFLSKKRRIGKVFLMTL